MHERHDGLVALIDATYEVRISIDAQRKLGEIVGTDGKTVTMREESFGQERVVRSGPKSVAMIDYL